MKIIDLDQDFIISFIADDYSFLIVTEFSFLSEYQKRFKQVKNNEVSCSSCTMNGLIIPVSQKFMEKVFELLSENTKEVLDRLKIWTKQYFKIDEEFSIKISIGNISNDNVSEILI